LLGFIFTLLVLLLDDVIQAAIVVDSSVLDKCGQGRFIAGRRDEIKFADLSRVRVFCKFCKPGYYPGV
jgi:hypothetical protein